MTVPAWAKGASTLAVALALLNDAARAASNQPPLPLDITAVPKSSTFYKSDTPPGATYRYGPRMYVGAAAWGYPGETGSAGIGSPLNDTTGATMANPQVGGYYLSNTALVAFSPNGGVGMTGIARAKDGVPNSTVMGVNGAVITFSGVVPASIVAGTTWYDATASTASSIIAGTVLSVSGNQVTMSASVSGVSTGDSIRWSVAVASGGIQGVSYADTQGAFTFSIYGESSDFGITGYDFYEPTGSGYTPNNPSYIQYPLVRLTDSTNPNVTGLVGDVYVNPDGQVNNVVVTGVGNTNFGAQLPAINDVLVPNPQDMGGTGSGAHWTVANVLYKQDPNTGIIVPNTYASPGEFDTRCYGVQTYGNPFLGNPSGCHGVVFANASRGGSAPDYLAAFGTNIDLTYSRKSQPRSIFRMLTTAAYGCDGFTVGYRCDTMEMPIGHQFRWWEQTNVGGFTVNVPGHSITADPTTTAGITQIHATSQPSDATLGNGHVYITGAPGNVQTLTTGGISTEISRAANGIGTSVNAGSFVANAPYVIATLGNTDFTLIGAPSNTVGQFFISSGPGTGTGTATTEVNGTGVYTVNSGSCTTPPTVNVLWLSGAIQKISVANPGICATAPNGVATLTYLSGLATGWLGAQANVTAVGGNGSGLVDGTYNFNGLGLVLKDVSGNTATFNGGQALSLNVTVSGGAVTAYSIQAPGLDYLIGDLLSPALCTTSASNQDCINQTGVTSGGVAPVFEVAAVQDSGIIADFDNITQLGTLNENHLLFQNAPSGSSPTISAAPRAGGDTVRGLNLKVFGDTTSPLAGIFTNSKTLWLDNVTSGNGYAVNATSGFTSLNGASGSRMSVAGTPVAVATAGLFSVTGALNVTAGYSANGVAGFSGTKVAGACTLTLSSGLVTNVTGC